MSHGMRRVLAAVIVAGALAAVAAVANAAWSRAGRPLFVTGASVLVLGAGLTAGRLVSAGRPVNPATARLWRGSWVGIVLGLAMLGLVAADDWITGAGARAGVQAAIGRGQAAARAGDWAAAVDAYSEAVRLDPDNADALRRRGTAHLHLRDYERALADLDAAHRLIPDDVGTVYNRGQAKARLGDTAGALADFTEAVRLDPTLARGYQARSIMHARLGNAAAAEADWQRAVDLDPALRKVGGLEL